MLTISQRMSFWMALFINVTASKAAPFWREIPANAQEASKHADLPPFVFAPGGRLYSVEKVAQAVYSEDSNTIVAIQCGEGTVVVSSTSSSPYLHNESRNETAKFWQSLSIIDDDAPPSMFCQLERSQKYPLWACLAGTADRIQLGRLEILDICDNYRGFGLDIAVVARSWADVRQRPTQTVGKERILACDGIIVSPQECWRIDVTGQLFKCHISVLGRRAAVVETLLLEKIRRGIDLEEGERISSRMVKEATRSWKRHEAQEIALDCLRQAYDKDRRMHGPDTVDPYKTCFHLLSVQDTGAEWHRSVDPRELS